MPNPSTHSPAPTWGLKSRRAAFSVFVAAMLWIHLLAHPAASAGQSESSEFVVIVHPTNALGSAPRSFVADAFLKRVSRWQDGETIHPIDMRPDSLVRKAFSESVLKRSVGAVRSYWLQRVFTGRELPPPELASEEAAVRYVESTPGALGYVSIRAKRTQAKVLSIR